MNDHKRYVRDKCSSNGLKYELVDSGKTHFVVRGHGMGNIFAVPMDEFELVPEEWETLVTFSGGDVKTEKNEPDLRVRYCVARNRWLVERRKS